MKFNLFINKFRRVISIALVVVFIILIGGSSFYVGYVRGSETPQTIIVKGITNIGDDDVTADFSTFWEAWKKLKELHIKGNEVKDQDFVYGAISGLVGALGDPNTAFFNPPDSKKFQEDISGSFGGIGAEIGLKEGQLVVVAPLKKSPAEAAGLKSGDQILKIDDFPTPGITVDAAVKKIRGVIGTKVVLTVLREGWDLSKEISIVRQEISVPTLDWNLVQGKFMHLKLHSFNENAPRVFYEAAVDTIVKHSKGIILDLRDDPGGFLDVAVTLAGWFLEKGQVVSTEHFRNDPDRVFKANGNEAFKDTPVVVLMNKGSASASEILAGALRVNRGVKLVGENSFGKGTVQELHSLKDGSQLKITVANWLLPNGEVIEKHGLKPDIEVKITDEDFKAKRDPQLEKAIEVLNEMLGKAVATP